MSEHRPITRVLSLTAASAAPVLYAPGVRPRLLTWGATHEETSGAYPGDGLIPDPAHSSTMATALPAPPERVWPWLVQMGYDRAGWYSWDTLDHGGKPSADQIVPQWQNLHRPCGLCMPYGHKPIFYVGEVGPAAAVSRDIPNLGPRVSIVDHEGKLIGRFGETPAGIELGKFLAPHGLAVDSHGDVYVGEVSWTGWPQIFPGTPRPAQIRCLQKFEKVA